MTGRRLQKALLPYLAAAVLGLAGAARAQDSASAGDPALLARVDEYMQAQLRVNRFSGSVLLARNAQVAVSKGYGLANAEWNIPNTPQTKFRIGSITKQFTAMAVLLLQERGKLSVQDPVCKFLADCPEAWKEITLHHLLSHTSGIPNFTLFADYNRTLPMPSPPAETVMRFRNRPLEFKPGERWNYSNSGYILLGLVIEKASGQSYESFVNENILQPLGMKDTGYDHPESVLRNRAAGYSARGDKFLNTSYIDMTIPGAAGSLYSTVEDLFKWDQALYTEKLLPAKSLEVMFAPVKNNYAYGWGVREQFHRRLAGHGGGINGFASFIARYPQDKATVIVLSNMEYAPVANIARDLAAILFGEKYNLPGERRVARVNPKLFDAYVGQYELSPGFFIEITREGNQLAAQATGQPKFDLFPESENTFFMKLVDAQITFVKDARGEVTELVLLQGGASQHARKIK